MFYLQKGRALCSFIQFLYTKSNFHFTGVLQKFKFHHMDSIHMIFEDH